MTRCLNCREPLDPDQDPDEHPLCEGCEAEARGEAEMYEDLYRDAQDD